MTAKEYLQQYRDAVRMVYATQDHLAEIRSIETRVNPDYSVKCIMQAEDRLRDEIENMEATECEIISAINNVKDGTLKTILYERYINGKTWERIACEMNYTYKHLVAVLHPKALKLFESCNKMRQNVIVNDLKTLL